MIIWLYGRPAAGKTTITEKFVINNPEYVYIDNDVFRTKVNNNFDIKGRIQNIIYAVEYIKKFEYDNIICSFITPFSIMRKMIKEQIPDVKIVYVKCSFGGCQDRDPKGLYKLAEKGEIENFTGYDSPFEEPEKPDLIIDTEKFNITESIKLLENCINDSL